MSIANLVPDVAAVSSRLAEQDYLAGPGLATALFCAVRLPQPLLLEGEAGVGKTQAANSVAVMLGAPLIRLQCFEGLSVSDALYEWNYPRQLLGIRVAEARGEPLDEHSLFTRKYLLERPLLQALTHPGPTPAVLLIDEVDRADEEFEAFLLEVLGEAAITVPELGTIRAAVPPVVILTSNRTRDLHDALKRRCLYHWIDYPDLERATQILLRRVPAAPAALVAQIAAAVQRLRGLDIQKPPGVAEAIDWASAAQLLGISLLSAEAADRTLGSVLKYREDQEIARKRGLAWVAGN